MPVEILETLERFGLGHAAQGFIDAGVTTFRQLTALTMQDYQSVGVVVMCDRRRLFEAIQHLKRDNAAAAEQNTSQLAASPARDRHVPSAGSSATSAAPQYRPDNSRALGRPYDGNRLATTQSSTGSTEVVNLDDDDGPPTTRPPPPPQSRPLYVSASQPADSAPPPRPAAPSRAAPQPNPTEPQRQAAPVRNSAATAGMRTASPAPVARAASAALLAPVPTNTGAPRRGRGRIIVAIRKRPLSAAEQEEGLHDIVVVDVEAARASVHESKTRVDLTRCIERHTFHYDVVLDERHSNADVYNNTARHLIDTVFEGGNATCFAYGQTGSGKTYTMLGKENQEGIYLMAARDLYSRLQRDMTITASFFEIYGDKLFDLLRDRNKLECREDAKGVVNVVGLSEHAVQDTRDLMSIIDQGNTYRAAGSTGMNSDSSRSHAILHIIVNKSNRPYGKFTFIDLAGSERAADTLESDRLTRFEGGSINKSLLTLKECIRALDQGHRHVPFRGSKLTAVLRDCFTGNSRTVMIGNVSPASGSCEHTLNTLRYADRVKELRKDSRDRVSTNEAMIGQVPTESVDVVSGGPSSFAQRRAQEKRAASRATSQPPQPRNTTDAGSSSNAAPRPRASPASAALRTRASAVPRSPVDVRLSDYTAASPNLSFGPSNGRGHHASAAALHRSVSDVNGISDEEEEEESFQAALIRAHRKHVDDFVAIVKREMSHIPPDGVIDEEYVTRIDAYISLKQQQLVAFRRAVMALKSKYGVRDGPTREAE